MGLVKFITRFFIDFFGITQPSPAEERRAVWMIFALMILVIAGVAAIFGLVVIGLRH